MTFRGGARIGIWNVSWPFAKMTITDEGITLNVFARAYSLSKERISKVERFRGLFSNGVRIVHDSAETDAHVVFWSFATDRVLTDARDHGFRTDRKTG